jgi:hypothetical protein
MDEHGVPRMDENAVPRMDGAGDKSKNRKKKEKFVSKVD